MHFPWHYHSSKQICSIDQKHFAPNPNLVQPRMNLRMMTIQVMTYALTIHQSLAAKIYICLFLWFLQATFTFIEFWNIYSLTFCIICMDWFWIRIWVSIEVCRHLSELLTRKFLNSFVYPRWFVSLGDTCLTTWTFFCPKPAYTRLNSMLNKSQEKTSYELEFHWIWLWLNTLVFIDNYNLL